MKTYTWAPGTDAYLDDIFEQTREDHYQSIEHRLRENYSKHSFEYADIVAYTIAFNDNNVPEICSTISNRPCWPDTAYRVLNRLWKHTNKVTHSKFISEAMVSNVRSQIKWLEENTDCDFYFISRQTDNWMKWVTTKFSEQYDINFTIADKKYLTCPNECDDSCWQRIIYIGNSKVLEDWKSK